MRFFKPNTDNNLKLIVLGDSVSGKTALLRSYTDDSYNDDYIPVVYHDFHFKADYFGQQINLVLSDTAGQEDYNRLRPLMYNGVQVFILTFSLVEPFSLENIRYKWLPEIQHHNSNVPFILVGTSLEKRDEVYQQRTDNNMLASIVSTEQGLACAREIGASGYFECSYFSLRGVKSTFNEAIKCGLSPDYAVKARMRLRKKDKSLKSCVVQ